MPLTDKHFAKKYVSIGDKKYYTSWTDRENAGLLPNDTEQILRNVATNPEDPKFRRVKRDNANFQRVLGRFEGGIQILLSSGFRMQVSH